MEQPVRLQLGAAEWLFFKTTIASNIIVPFLIATILVTTVQMSGASARIIGMDHSFRASPIRHRPDQGRHHGRNWHGAGEGLGKVALDVAPDIAGLFGDKAGRSNNGI